MVLGLPAKVGHALTIGSQMVCDDNSGAKLVEIIGVAGAGTRLRRYPSVGVSGIVTVSVKKASKLEMLKKKEKAVIVRQKKEFRRGKQRIRFEDNACVLIDDQNLPKGTEIKGAVAREIAEAFPKVVAIASIVV